MPSSSKERVFIGDVHGCADELQDLLEKLHYDPASQALYFVGDLVNRGPKSLQTLRDVISLGAESVLGNHELHLLARADGRRQPAPLDTLDELLAAPDSDTLLDWVRDRPAVQLWPDLILVHAGLPTAWDDLEIEAARINRMLAAATPLTEDPELTFLVSARYCDANGNQVHSEYSRALAGSTDPAIGDGPTSVPQASWTPWYERYGGHRTVVFGHWADRGLVNAERLRGLDTGCVWGGLLTAWIAEKNQFVSVAARKQYQKP